MNLNDDQKALVLLLLSNELMVEESRFPRLARLQLIERTIQNLNPLYQRKHGVPLSETIEEVKRIEEVDRGNHHRGRISRR